MQIVVFRATLRTEASRREHQDISGQARRLAESVGGFVGWRDALDDMTYWGYALFESPDAALEWKNHPAQDDLRRRGRDDVYREYATHAFDAVRNSSWRSPLP